MTINVKNIEHLPRQSKEILLRDMIQNAFLWWYKDAMKELDIQGRTRLYKAFSWSSWNSNDQQTMTGRDPKNDAVERILDQSTISVWADRYLKHFTLSQFTLLYQSATKDIVLDGSVDVRVVTD